MLLKYTRPLILFYEHILIKQSNSSWCHVYTCTQHTLIISVLFPLLSCSSPYTQLVLPLLLSRPVPHMWDSTQCSSFRMFISLTVWFPVPSIFLWTTWFHFPWRLSKMPCVYVTSHSLLLMSTSACARPFLLWKYCNKHRCPCVSRKLTLYLQKSYSCSSRTGIL